MESAARSTPGDPRPAVLLLIEPDREDRDVFASWLEEHGFQVMMCPGPGAPSYICLGGRGGPCPLAEAADLIILDLNLDSELVREGTSSSDLLAYYSGLHKPVVAFGPDEGVAAMYAGSGVRTIPWPVQRDDLIDGVRTLLYEREPIDAVSLSIIDAEHEPQESDPQEQVQVEAEGLLLPGVLSQPMSPTGIVLFAHGSGSSRLSPRNQLVSDMLVDGGLATLLFDLLTPEEEFERSNVFDVELLAGRLEAATSWVKTRPLVGDLPIGYFGASTGAGAALWAAADLRQEISAVVSRGGRPDLAAPRLEEVLAPTLLIVGGLDDVVLQLNRRAQRGLLCPTHLEVVAGATHLFEERGAMEEVATLARDWFTRHL